MATKYLDFSGLSYFWRKLKAYFQPMLSSGVNIKTINNTSLLGSGNIDIQDDTFFVVYGVSEYAEIYDAYFSGQSVICLYEEFSGVPMRLPLAFFDEGAAEFIFEQLRYDNEIVYISIDSTDFWDARIVEYATVNIATTSSNGLMSSSDKSKLNGIASGAEVNVQSDWNQSTSTADDYIKNKPTIPSRPSDIGAQEALGTLTVTLTAAGWSSNTQTVTVTGVTSSNTVIISPSPSNMEDYTNAGIVCTTQETNSLTFECDTTPTSAIDVNVVII